jgi:hypothetical protein
MISRRVSTRLERLEEERTSDAPEVLKILVTRVGGPDKIIRLALNEPHGRWRGVW